MCDYKKVKAKLDAFNQGHLLQFWDRLNEAERKVLLEQVESFDQGYIKRCFDLCTEDLKKTSHCNDADMEPVPPSVFGSVNGTSLEKIKEYEAEGFKQIGRGKVAVLLLAGGQGTRLGVSFPKGMYNVGLPSGKSLFHLMAERLSRMQQLASEACGRPCVVPWYIMTSEQTQEATVKYFDENDYFGLSKENVTFFRQGFMPCMEFDGRIILDSPHTVAQSPDGNGGLYSALHRNKIIEDFDKRSIEYLHVYCVDNILVRIADPVFIGFCISKKARCGFKVVEKTNPTEPVGVICKLKGRYHVLEYSEISKEVSEMRTENGKLTFNGGGIANHFFTVEFIKEIIQRESGLRHHVAKKKISYCDDNGLQVKPSSPNGIKMEKFIFDVFHFTDDFAVWEVNREDEFSPLKNADSAGCDCPSTARNSIFALHRNWVEKAGGVVVAKDSQSDASTVCEISPLVTYAGEGLENIVGGKSFTEPLCINEC